MSKQTAIVSAAPEDKKSIVSVLKVEINRQLADPETLKSLLETTFKGLDAQMMKRALLEGMMRGLPFEAFLKKDVYAIPFAGGYSLVTSIDYARKIGARSGVVGVDAPVYREENGRVISCAVTVHKKIGDYVGDFTAEVYISEYSTGRNLWASKPRTMISKVAEGHALRKACPEELAQNYFEEEVQRETIKAEVKEITSKDYSEESDALFACQSIEALNKYFADLSGEAKVALKGIYDGQKAILEQEAKDAIV